MSLAILKVNARSTKGQQEFNKLNPLQGSYRSKQGVQGSGIHLYIPDIKSLNSGRFRGIFGVFQRVRLDQRYITDQKMVQLCHFLAHDLLDTVQLNLKFPCQFYLPVSPVPGLTLQSQRKVNRITKRSPGIVARSCHFLARTLLAF